MKKTYLFVEARHIEIKLGEQSFWTTYGIYRNKENIVDHEIFPAGRFPNGLPQTIEIDSLEETKAGGKIEMIYQNQKC